MKFASIPDRIRLTLLRTLMRLAGFLLRRFVAPGLRPAAARARNATDATVHGRVIDGESRRVDPRHNERW